MEIYMSEIEQHIYPISLPLPYALKQITAYVVKDKDRLTIIDTGLHTSKTSKVWQQIFLDNKWDWNHVEKIIVTHYHPDHYGFAGELQRWSGATVHMAKSEYDQIQSFWNRIKGNPSQVASFFVKYGFPLDQLPAINRHMEDFRLVLEPHPQEVHFLQDGESVEIGGESFQVIKTPGHSDGHLSFLHDSGVFFAGDVILPKITPNIPLLPKGDPNPLSTFFLLWKR